MTLNDFLKRVKNCSPDAMMTLVDENGGWANLNVEVDEDRDRIRIFEDRKPLFD